MQYIACVGSNDILSPGLPSLFLRFKLITCAQNGTLKVSLAKYILSVRTNNMAREPMGVGLFFYGVGEPVAHYTGNNKFYADPYLPGNLYPRAQPVSNLFNMMIP